MLKQLCQGYKNTIDWDVGPVLEQETFEQEFTYDAMNHPTQITKPDNTIEGYSYNKAALLERINVTHGGKAVDYLTNINYNEKGQHTEIYFSNFKLSENERK